MLFLNLPIAHSVVDPLGGAQSFVGRAPVEETGVAVETVQQVGGGSDHTETHRKYMGNVTLTHTHIILVSEYCFICILKNN